MDNLLGCHFTEVPSLVDVFPNAREEVFIGHLIPIILGKEGLSPK